MLSIIATMVLVCWGDNPPSAAISISANSWLDASRFRPDTPLDPDRVLVYLNDLRARPHAWRSFVDSVIVLWEDGQPPRMLQHLLGTEGYSLLAEVRRYLDTVTPAPPLRHRPCLEQVAAGHAVDVAKNPNGNPHRGSNGNTLTQRIMARCNDLRSFGECVDHLSSSASTVVLRLLFDPDVPGRGHRSTLLDPGYRTIGIGGAPCPKHPILGNGYVVVLTFGGE